MKNSTPGLPPGFRDTLMEEARKRRAIETKLADLFGRNGYGEVRPSGVEFLDLYTRGNQNIIDRVFKFLDRGDNLLALRADFTPAIARIVAGTLKSAAPPVRIWYTGNVFRRAGTHRGRFSEFGQIGAELLGEGPGQGDLEMVGLVMECLEAIGLGDIRIHLNHAGVLGGIVDSLGLDDRAGEEVREVIHRRDARGLSSRLESLGIARDVREQLSALPGLVGGTDVLTRAADVICNPRSAQAIEELMRLASGLEGWGERILFDLAEMDEMEYYTGIMFTLLTPRLPMEVGLGGRYDSLLGEFGAPMPAVGFCLSMDGLVGLA